MGVKISLEEAFTFDDVLIKPSRSAIEPREASLFASIVRGITLSTPLLSAAMDRVTDATLAVALFCAGGLGVLHRNCTIPAQTTMVKSVKKKGARVGAACGPFDRERAQALKEAGVDILFIDCAHGHNAKVIASARAIKKESAPVPLVVGNIATEEAARDLAGIADAVKVGVGPGSICTTRIISGVGMPQLSAVRAVSGVAHRLGMQVIADGGIRMSGDIAKALAAGADSVMLGNIFAGTREAPGKIVTHEGKTYKEYRGMGSRAVLEEKNSSDRYLTEGRKAVPEGVEGLVPYRGTLADVAEELCSGVQVAMGYVGARTIPEFQKKARFVRVTSASVFEGTPHSLVMPNV